MAIKKSDVIKVGAGFGVGVTATIVADKLVIPSIKKAVAKKKEAKAATTVDVSKANNPNNG